MKIAVDVSPLRDESKLAHRVRGVGFYTEQLLASLERYYKQHTYIPFTRENQIPSDVDMIHYPYFEPFFFTLPFNKKKKTIITVHDLTPMVFPQNFPVGIKGTIRWKLQRSLLKKVDHIISDSNTSKNDIMKIVGIDSASISTIYLAAADEFRKVSELDQISSLRAKYSLPKKFVLYVGDVTWNKNVPRLIEAITLANIPIVLVGKSLAQTAFDKKNLWNQDMVHVEALTRENPLVTKVGFVSREELVLFYNAASVFVMPSLYEGFGLPVLEAMQCFCPVITSNRGSLPEVAGDAAYVIDPEDVVSIKDGLLKVFNDTSLQKSLAERGLNQAEKFSWRQTATETVAVYQKVYNA